MYILDSTNKIRSKKQRIIVHRLKSMNRNDKTTVSLKELPKKRIFSKRKEIK